MKVMKHYRLSNKALYIKEQWSNNRNRDLGELMKLTTPFTILNRKFNEMDLIRNALKSKEKFATKRLHDDYRKMFKSDPLLCSVTKNLQL